MGEFVDDLLKALKDKKVREKIREIVDEEDKKKPLFFKEADSKDKEKINNLTNAVREEKEKNVQLENEVTRLQRMTAEREEKLRQVQKESERLRKKLDEAENRAFYAEKIKELIRQENETERAGYQKLLKEAEQSRDYYRNRFHDMDACYCRYLQLGEELLHDLSRVLSADSPEKFFCSGSQWGNIEALWEFIDVHLGQDKYTQETLAELEKIFDYFFSLYQEVYGTYERLNTSIGDEFDENYHKRKGDSLVSGRISQVLLCGYQGRINKKVQKSVVRI